MTCPGQVMSKTDSDDGCLAACSSSCARAWASCSSCPPTSAPPQTARPLADGAGSCSPRRAPVRGRRVRPPRRSPRQDPRIDGVSAHMEGGPRACGVAADRWWYRGGGGGPRASEPSVRGVRPVRRWCVAVAISTRNRGCHSSFTVTADRSISKGAPDACIRAALAKGSADRIY
jgi:hypothetical protein